MENGQAKPKFPVGMILLLVLVGWGIVSLPLTMFKFHMVQLGPVLVGGAGAIVVDLVMLGIAAAVFYGIIKRLKWARKLAIGWYVFSIALSLVNLISFFGNRNMYDSYYRELLSPEMYPSMTPDVIAGSLIYALTFSSIMGVVIIIYLARKKDFFVN